MHSYPASAVYSQVAKIDTQAFQPGVCTGMSEVMRGSDEIISIKIK